MIKKHNQLPKLKNIIEDKLLPEGKETLSVRLQSSTIQKLETEISEMKKNDARYRTLTITRYISALIESYTEQIL